MANTNTVAAVYNTPTVTLNTTTPTVIAKAGSPVVVGLGANDNFDGARPFSVNLRGTATGGTTTSLQFKVYLGTSATVASNTLVATYTAGAQVGAAGGNFNLVTELSWDSISTAVNGFVYGQCNGTLTPYALISTGVTAASVANLQFVVVAIFGAANATNTISMTEFSIAQA